MRDRVSTKILDNGASRYGVYDETGDLLRYEYIKLEDEPSTEGDFFNKANMLPDSIPKLLGLKMENPQVKDALNVLANVGNLHVWERVRILSEPIYKPVQSDANTTVMLEPGDILYYSSGIDVVGLEESDISLSEPVSSFSYNGSNFPDVVGKYIRQDGSDLVYYYPTSDQNISGTTLWIRGCKKISAAIDTPAGTTTDYLTSTDRNAYTDGTVGNTTINYLGQLGGGARIEVGSYVGTGTYGSSNPNSLTFVFEPKMVCIFEYATDSSGRSRGTLLDTIKPTIFCDMLKTLYKPGGLSIRQTSTGFNLSTSNSGSAEYVAKKSSDGKTISWYCSDSSTGTNAQGNISGQVYKYFAIG